MMWTRAFAATPSSTARVQVLLRRSRPRPMGSSPPQSAGVPVFRKPTTTYPCQSRIQDTANRRATTDRFLLVAAWQPAHCRRTMSLPTELTPARCATFYPPDRLRSFAFVLKIIKDSHTICLRPDTDRSGSCDRVVLGLDLGVPWPVTPLNQPVGGWLGLTSSNAIVSASATPAKSISNR